MPTVLTITVEIASGGTFNMTVSTEYALIDRERELVMAMVRHFLDYRPTPPPVSARSPETK